MYYDVAAYKMNVQPLPGHDKSDVDAPDRRNELLRTRGFRRAFDKSGLVNARHFYPPLTINFDEQQGPQCDMQ